MRVEKGLNSSVCIVPRHLWIQIDDVKIVWGDALRYKQFLFGAGLARDLVVERALVNRQLPTTGTTGE